MNKSTKPQLSFSLGANHLHGLLRDDQNRADTLVQLVAKWDDEDVRDEVIAALDALSSVVRGVRREGELDAALEQVEDVAAMDTAQTEISVPDARRLLTELGAVASRLSRFNPVRRTA